MQYLRIGRIRPRWGVVLGGLIVSSGLLSLPVVADEATESEQRLARFTQLLSTDEMQGRGVGTQGLDVAADYIAEEFRRIGLKTDVVDGGPFQKFTITTSSKLGEHNSLAWTGPPAEEGGEPTRIELELGDHFTPLAIGGSSEFDLPLVFVGYGITGEEEKYDDYADGDVKGKAVIVLRHEPQQDNPHSAFAGTENSRHAPFREKVSNAFQHGAAAIIFCTDQVEIERRVAQTRRRWQATIDSLMEAEEEFREIESPTLDQVEEHREAVEEQLEEIRRWGNRVRDQYDPVFEFNQAGEDADGRSLPVFHCRREVVERLVEASLGKDLATLEREIDQGPTPQSAELTGWRAVGQTDLEREEVEVKNVIGVLEGDGSLADETVIVGAHYDHVGFGGPGSRSPGSDAVHNGADDNASGTAGLLEVARRLSERSGRLPRRVVFIAFTAEERGLLGSAHYVENPVYPLDKTVAMLNMDMVGRLDDNKLIVYGTETAEQFDGWIDRFNETDSFDITRHPDGFGPSDHASFYAKDIPVLHFFTGTHEDYHRPSDDFPLINVTGMRRIVDMITELALEIATAPERPAFHKVERPQAGPPRGDGDRPYFGSIPNFAQEGGGYGISGVSEGSPAAKAGMEGGDVIVKLGDRQIGNLEDFDSALRRFDAGEKVPVVVKRDGNELTLEVVLDPPR